MPNISRTEKDRAHGAPSQLTGLARRAKTLGGVLLLALLLPSAPAFSAALSATHSVTLLWDSNPRSDEVAGYRVYFGTESRNYSGSVTVGNATSGTVPGLTTGTAYFFAVTAFDASGLESGFSAEVRYVPSVPSGPKIQTRMTPGGQMILRAQGVAGRFFYVEASEDLINWTVIDAVLFPSATALELTDPDAANFAKRFYRLRELLL